MNKLYPPPHCVRNVRNPHLERMKHHFRSVRNGRFTDAMKSGLSPHLERVSDATDASQGGYGGLDG